MDRATERIAEQQTGKPGTEAEVGQPEGTSSWGMALCGGGLSGARHQGLLRGFGALRRLVHILTVAPLAFGLALALSGCQRSEPSEEFLETEDLGEAPTGSFGFEEDVKEQKSSLGAAGAVPADFPAGLEMPSSAVVEGWGSEGDSLRWVSFRVPAGWQVEAWQDAHWSGRRAGLGARPDEPGSTTWKQGDSLIRTRWLDQDGQRLLQIVYPVR